MSKWFYIGAFAAVAVIWSAVAVIAVYKQYADILKYGACIKYHSPKECK